MVVYLSNLKRWPTWSLYVVYVDGATTLYHWYNISHLIKRSYIKPNFSTRGHFDWYSQSDQFKSTDYGNDLICVLYVERISHPISHLETKTQEINYDLAVERSLKELDMSNIKS